MAAPAPLADTQRIVDWEELPSRVREMRDDFDPTLTGVWMAHQTGWIKFSQELDIAVAEKGRRTGITLAEAQNDTLISACDKEAGGMDVFYIGDTREKGLEFIGYCAKMARVVARGQATGIEQHIFYDQKKDGETREIQAFRIRFASGYRIVALSSRPENIHGLQGKVVIDEAALHKNVGAVLESATALLIWGGKIVIISTHRGKKNPFNGLIADIKAGRYGARAGVFRVTFDDAVANGLYERVCWMTRRTPSEADKKEWYLSIRKAYGTRTAAMREELDAIPRDGSGSALPSVWIEAAMPAERPIRRLVLPDEFVHKTERDRMIWADVWIATQLLPLIAQFDAPGIRWAIGMDFARHRHFSVITPAIITQALARDVPFLIEMANVPQRQQEQILWALLDRLKRWTFAGDATGPGQGLMEYTGDRYGRADPATGRGGRVHEIQLSRVWYGEWMPKYINLFEDTQITMPRDASLEDDHRAIEYIDGIPMVPRLERKDLKDPDLIRHGDGAIAGVLMNFAAYCNPIEYDFTAAPKGQRDGTDEPDDDYNSGGGAW